MNVAVAILKAPSRGAAVASAPVGLPAQKQDKGPEDQKSHDEVFHLASPGPPARSLEEAEGLPRDITHDE